MRYVALLRGVNVGGANKVSMADLKTVFIDVGMTDVVTYINSGNIIFSAEEPDRARLAPVLEAAILDRLGLSVGVLIRDLEQMRVLIDALPESWRNDESMKCDVLFLWDDIDDPQIMDDLPFRPEIDDSFYVPGAVVRRVDRKDASRSGLIRVVGSPVYQRMTIRNCNTARKIMTLMEG